MKPSFLFFLFLFTALVWLSVPCQAREKEPGLKKKLLYVNSYHQGYKWSDDIEKGLFKSLDIVPDPNRDPAVTASGIQVKIFRMGTKLTAGEEIKKEAGRQAKNLIDQWQPDIVVTSDDSAAKYLIVPFYRNSTLPFVFCGLNWEASEYGFPSPHVTGMIEVSPYLDTIDLMKKFARGPRLGIIGHDGLTNRKEIIHIKKMIPIEDSRICLASDFESWKKGYLEFQNTADMLLLISPIGISGWSRKEAERFILEHTRIVTGGASDNNISYALLGRTKIAEEQGWWAGKTALKILEGARPSDIPVVANRHSKLYLNMKLAGRLGIKFPMDLVTEAILIGEEIR